MTERTRVNGSWTELAVLPLRAEHEDIGILLPPDTVPCRPATKIPLSGGFLPALCVYGTHIGSEAAGQRCRHKNDIDSIPCIFAPDVYNMFRKRD
jgi:hypothetical protein